MAVMRNGTRDTQLISKLATRLADELRLPSEHTEPRIYENQIAQTKTYHVTVVWQAWQGLAMQARSRAILDAYASAKPEMDGRIAIAQGLTIEEARSLGFLPFSVKAILRNAEVSVLDRVRRALGGENEPLEMRFHTREEAENAYERVQREVPGPWWTIIEELQPTT